MTEQSRAIRRSGGMRRLAVRAVAVVLGLYLAVVGAMFFAQRELQYRPDPRFTLPEVQGVPIQVVRLTTSDGERLVAWYLPPLGERPVILHLNGNAGALVTQ